MPLQEIMLHAILKKYRRRDEKKPRYTSHSSSQQRKENGNKMHTKGMKICNGIQNYFLFYEPSQLNFF